MAAAKTTVKYVGGMDEVVIYCPTSDSSYKVSPGDEVELLAITAAGLSELEWETIEPKKTTTKKDDA